MQYYSAIYRDPAGKVLQVADDIDGLSCEILADPGVKRSADFKSVAVMVKTARTAALVMNCHHVEINCSRGNGSYRWLTATV